MEWFKKQASKIEKHIKMLWDMDFKYFKEMAEQILGSNSEYLDMKWDQLPQQVKQKIKERYLKFYVTHIDNLKHFVLGSVTVSLKDIEDFFEYVDIEGLEKLILLEGIHWPKRKLEEFLQALYIAEMPKFIYLYDRHKKRIDKILSFLQ